MTGTKLDHVGQMRRDLFLKKKNMCVCVCVCVCVFSRERKRELRTEEPNLRMKVSNLNKEK